MTTIAAHHACAILYAIAIGSLGALIYRRGGNVLKGFKRKDITGTMSPPSINSA